MSIPASALTLDLVIPLYNEADIVDLLFQTLDETFCAENLTPRQIASVRYLFVDDGSSDQTARMVSERIRAGASAALFRLSRNFGHANAISAGLDHATADLVAVLDADLQDPPAVVLEMIDRTRDGYDVVYGQRRRRQENFVKRAGYWVFYRLVAFLSDVKIPLDSGDFCLMNRRVIVALRDLPERLRYPRILRAWVGFRQIGVEYDRPGRQAGSSKYTAAKLYRLATDGIAAASIRPLKIAQLSSFLFGLVAAGLTLLFILMLAGQGQSAISMPFLLISLLIASGHALTMLCLYVFSAYLGRLYLEVKGRPAYIIMEQVPSLEESQEGRRA
ncbi:MAG TPA: glycosyltransferase family 2 protein [Vicinamibacterales bacterium]|jgi:dolichol-phosphate mannosyltransferase